MLKLLKVLYQLRYDATVTDVDPLSGKAGARVVRSMLEVLRSLRFLERHCPMIQVEVLWSCDSSRSRIPRQDNASLHVLAVCGVNVLTIQSGPFSGREAKAICRVQAKAQR